MKSSLENEKAQYVQYVYDEQGNKVRQFTGMTGPLTVMVAAVENAKDDAGKDTFTYGGKTYAVLVTGKKKSDTIRETKYVYDTKNRLVSYTDPEGRTETYTYDCNSNLTKTVDKNGNTLKNTYDNKNRLTERTAKEKKTGKETVHTYSYNAYGDVAVQDDTQFVYGDVSGQVTKETTKLTKNKDVVKNYTYDSNGNKSTFSVKAGEDTKLSLSYEYDGSSRLISVKDSEGKQAVSYAYDMLGRITRETKTGREDISYTYDANNNRKQMTIGNKTTAYQYNKNDELLRTDTLHTDTEKNDVVIYKNDKNGNQLATVNRSEIPAEAKDTSYIDVDVTLGDNQLNDNVVNHHNALNQLTETLTKNYKVSFTYDAEGLRTGKTVNGEKTVYVWDGDQVVMELSKGGAVQKRYIRGNDLVYADKGENTEKTYYVTDMHGNVVQLLDESGNVTKTYEYDSYTGESDEPLSLHLYTYCENDGVNAWDPSGHKIKLATKSKKKKKKILTTLYKLTGNKLKIMNKGHYKGYVLFKKAAFSPPLKYPKSMDLVISIMISNKICKITYDTKKVYYTKCKNIENASNGKGTSVTINFNPKQNVSVLTCVYNKKESRYENKMKKIPAYIALGHELIHAYIDFDGSNVGVGTYSNEYKTVGLSKENYPFTENELREEHGLGRRLEY